MKAIIRFILLLGIVSLSFGQNDYTKTIENNFFSNELNDKNKL